MTDSHSLMNALPNPRLCKAEPSNTLPSSDLYVIEHANIRGGLSSSHAQFVTSSVSRIIWYSRHSINILRERGHFHFLLCTLWGVYSVVIFCRAFLTCLHWPLGWYCSYCAAQLGTRTFERKQNKTSRLSGRHTVNTDTNHAHDHSWECPSRRLQDYP